MRIVQNIADVEDVEPHQLDLELQRHISTEAIRQLEMHERDSWELQFETPNHAVTITENDAVLIDEESPFSD